MEIMGKVEPVRENIRWTFLLSWRVTLTRSYDSYLTTGWIKEQEILGITRIPKFDLIGRFFLFLLFFIHIFVSSIHQKLINIKFCFENYKNLIHIKI